MMEELKKKLLDLLGEEGFRAEESMAKHTTFRTGGPADLFLMPQNRIELKESIALLREYNVPYLVIGNGSNLLVGDGGIRGAVIQLYQRMQNISIEGTEMTLDCGALLSAAAAQAADASLEGLAFASGIPGTFGGAVVMNAGAYVTGSQLKRLGEYYAKAIHDKYGDDFDVLFGPAYKGIPISVVTAIAYSELYG